MLHCWWRKQGNIECTTHQKIHIVESVAHQHAEILLQPHGQQPIGNRVLTTARRHVNDVVHFGTCRRLAQGICQVINSFVRKKNKQKEA